MFKWIAIRHAPRVEQETLLCALCCATGMTKGQKSALKVRPSYGFHHPDCKMKAPPGVPSNQRLNFLITLVQWYSADQVGHTPLRHDMGFWTP